MNLRKELESRVSRALRAAGAPEGSPALVMPAGRPEFGDYQANGAMAAAKKLKCKPRELAEKVLTELSPGGAEDLSDLAESVELAGPGFLNIRLKDDWLIGQLAETASDNRLGTAAADPPQTIVIDYSSPNLAKEMHVGHLRSTIIGDALARTLEFLGHRVIRQNHVGDWGTQFGMLVARLKHLLLEDPSGSAADLQLADLEEFYREAKVLFDSDPGFADAAREEVVRLQSGEQATHDMWHRFREISIRHAEAVYRRLGASLEHGDIRGESAYNDDLPNVVADLEKGGLLKESRGARCVFLDEFTNRDGEPLPLIIQKSDEGYLYATTDLAAIRYRVGQLHADRILYVVGAPQAQHFQMVFAVARKAGFAPPEVSLEHVAFGSMLGSDGRPFRTRAGGTVKLMALLDEAVGKALALVTRKNTDDPSKAQGKLSLGLEEGESSPDSEGGESSPGAGPPSDEQKRQIADAVGIGAVKYADLSQNRTSDYVFSFEKMLALDGNTAPYMQYAYARIRSIFRKMGADGSMAAGRPASPSPAAPSRTSASVPVSHLSHPCERRLALKLLQFPEAVEAVAADCLPNGLCAYLFELTGVFTSFYENCPVLKSDGPIRSGRLALCERTARTIGAGLDLLGIRTLEQM